MGKTFDDMFVNIEGRWINLNHISSIQPSFEQPHTHTAVVLKNGKTLVFHTKIAELVEKIRQNNTI